MTENIFKNQGNLQRFFWENLACSESARHRGFSGTGRNMGVILATMVRSSTEHRRIRRSFYIYRHLTLSHTLLGWLERPEHMSRDAVLDSGARSVPRWSRTTGIRGYNVCQSVLVHPWTMYLQPQSTQCSRLIDELNTWSVKFDNDCARMVRNY